MKLLVVLACLLLFGFRLGYDELEPKDYEITEIEIVYQNKEYICWPFVGRPGAMKIIHGGKLFECYSSIKLKEL